MLEYLRIKNLAIIDDLTIEFGDGLNILTGETGAGKSIIIGALNLVLGERASTDDIRTGFSTAEIEALFVLKANQSIEKLLSDSGISFEDGRLIVRRSISSSAKGKTFINDVLVPLSKLREIGNYLVDIHGQHQHQSLLSQESHIDALDNSGSYSALIDKFSRVYSRYVHLKQKYNSLLTDDREVERMKSVLEFQINEIENAALAAGEDKELQIERNRLLNAEKLMSHSHQAYNLLYEGEGLEKTIIQDLTHVLTLIAEIVEIDKTLKKEHDELETIVYQLQDAAAALRNYKETIQAQPNRLEQVHNRLDLIKSLKQKYGSSIEDILEICARFKSEYHQLQARDEEIAETKKQLTALMKELVVASERLSAKRKKHALSFEKAIENELKQLNMPSVNFSAKIWEIEGNEDNGVEIDGGLKQVNDKGIDYVEFLISPNPGESLKPLRKIASGGELSRIMLALKTLIATKDKIPVLVFDEIDVGISGETGDRIGERLFKLGRSHQVLCITHLPQIACCADHHFAVAKTTDKNRTTTRVSKLPPSERVSEISRLIEGESKSELGMEYAKKMLASKKFLKNITTT